MNAVQDHWHAKFLRLGYIANASPDPRDTAWGFVIERDDQTENTHRPYTQIEAHLVAARLLEIGCDPKAWTATVMRDDDNEEDEFEVMLVWNDPEPRKPKPPEKPPGKKTASTSGGVT